MVELDNDALVVPLDFELDLDLYLDLALDLVVEEAQERERNVADEA